MMDLYFYALYLHSFAFFLGCMQKFLYFCTKIVYLYKIIMKEDSKDSKKEPRLVYGQKALAERLGVTQATISRWQSAGKLSGCFCRVGKNVVYDLDCIWEKFAG